MSGRRNIAGGAPWESVAGYSRAVRAGPYVHVAGTTATDEAGEIIGVGDARAQTLQAIANLQRGLEKAGAGLEDVVRTRMFVTDIARWEEFARAHGEVFGDIRPASTLVEVAALIHPDMLIEVEADAYRPDLP